MREKKKIQRDAVQSSGLRRRTFSLEPDSGRHGRDALAATTVVRSRARGHVNMRALSSGVQITMISMVPVSLEPGP